MSEAKVWYEVWINGTRKLDPGPISLMITRQVGLNSLVVAKVARPFTRDPNPADLPEPGTPVKVLWGTRPDKLRTWYGYIHYTRPDQDHSEGPRAHEVVEYAMLGTGLALENQRTRDWREITDSGIALKIAEEYGLACVVHQTKRVHRYLLQPGISDLEWLRRRARECERRVHVENGVLYFVDPASLAMARKQQPIRSVMHKGWQADEITNVEPLYGALVPRAGKQAQRVVSGVDVRTNQLLETKAVPQKPILEWVARDANVADVAELYERAAAYNVEHEEWLYAKMTIEHYSNVDHVPGQLVDIDGRAVHPQMRGVWMVTQSRHYLESRFVSGTGIRRFDSELVITRNSPNTYSLRDRQVPMIDDSCMLSGNFWVSTNQRKVIL